MLRYLRRNNSLGDRIDTVAGRGLALFDCVSRAVCRDGGSFGETGPNCRSDAGEASGVGPRMPGTARSCLWRGLIVLRKAADSREGRRRVTWSHCTRTNSSLPAQFPFIARVAAPLIAMSGTRRVLGRAGGPTRGRPGR
jgi:hypothetical protein